MSGHPGRRAVMTGIAVGLSGCGFHPLYAPSGVTSARLDGIFVDIIADRRGQILRQALQQHLEGSGTGAAKRYELSVFYFVSSEGLSIQSDNSSTRTRFIGNATWVLRSVAPTAVWMAGGTARALDGANVIDEQFFYSDLSGEAIERRLSEAIAGQIVQSLAVYFREHPKVA